MNSGYCMTISNSSSLLSAVISLILIPVVTCRCIIGEIHTSIRDVFIFRRCSHLYRHYLIRTGQRLRHIYILPVCIVIGAEIITQLLQIGNCRPQGSVVHHCPVAIITHGADWNIHVVDDGHCQIQSGRAACHRQRRLRKSHHPHKTAGWSIIARQSQHVLNI